MKQPFLSRRRVVGAAAVMSAAAARGSAANSAVTVGLIGAGGRGTYDAGLLVKHTGARLVALCDIFDEQIERARAKIPAADAKAYKRMDELLASDVDAVIIATPVYLHPEHFEAAVKAGKHIYIEKPAGLDVEGCKRVMHAADGADRKLNIAFGFQQRYGPGYRKGHKLVTSGAIGPLRVAHAHWIKGAVPANNIPIARPANEIQKIKDWHSWRDTYGDYIVETYCHGVDVLNWFLGGHPESALGSASKTVIQRGDMRDHCTVTFTYKDSRQATLTGTQITPRFYRDVHETFYCADGVVETAREYWRHHRGKGDVLEEREPMDITANGLQEFVQRIRDGKPENTGVRSAESTLTAIMARTSMDLKREVTWAEIMK
ncbi:MAG: Gfo/Idh/MocA family oxidoreductase [Bryobacteraceae bacterium]